MRQFATATKYVRTDFVMNDVNGNPADPTGFAVTFAFTPEQTPPDDDTVWYTGAWDTKLDGTYTARCLVGPEGVAVLDHGKYGIFIKVITNPQIDVEEVGPLYID